MNTRIDRYTIILAALSVCGVLLSLAGCGSFQIAGTGSQAGNGRITCAVYNNDGTPAADAGVYLRRSDFTADTSGRSLTKKAASQYDGRTNEAGIFTIDSVDTGEYCIEINDERSHAVLLKCTITGIDSLVQIPDAMLKSTGTIRGAYASVPGAGISTYVMVKGLERVGLRDSAASGFVIKDVPEGDYSLGIISSSPLNALKEIKNVHVISNQTTDIGNVDFLPISAWKFSKRLYLNTSPAGANVTGNVYDFPVLIRLTGANFTFGEADKNGADVRFTKQDNTSLAFEIEHWDASSGSAEIWVKIDTVFGNDKTHYITMFWGAATGLITGASNSAAVFDTAQGFQGVWHLGQGAKTLAKDATVNHYDGTPSDSSPVPAPGIIGTGYKFDGISNFIVMKNTANSTMNFPQNGQYTLAAWVYADTLDFLPQGDTSYKNDMTIVSKDNCQYALKTRLTNWEFFEFRANAGWECSHAPAVKRSWKYVVGIRNGTRQYLYVDGQCIVDSVSEFQSLLSPRSTAADVTIGKMAGKRHPTDLVDANCNYFNGILDEIRISSVSRTPDWIKLCFMNQKADDALVVFP